MTAPTTVPSRDALLSDAVARTVAGLQRQYLAGVPAAGAALAVLRRAIGREPGSVPAAWQLTVGMLPASVLGGGDEPSPSEWAAHVAVTLYALHQQSQSAGMHRPGPDLGAAVRDLRRVRHADTGDVDPVLRRFQALATATSADEVQHHLRGLITLLRGAGIPLDYGRLAVDLRRLQSPRAADGVRLSWARSLYQPGPAGNASGRLGTETTGDSA